MTSEFSWPNSVSLCPALFCTPRPNLPVTPGGFPGGSDGKVSVCSAGDPGSIPGLGRCPDEGNGSPLQYSSLENPAEPGRLPSMGSQRVGHD